MLKYIWEPGNKWVNQIIDYFRTSKTITENFVFCMYYETLENTTLIYFWLMGKYQKYCFK